MGAKGSRERLHCCGGTALDTSFTGLRLRHLHLHLYHSCATSGGGRSGNSGGAAGSSSGKLRSMPSLRRHSGLRPKSISENSPLTFAGSSSPDPSSDDCSRSSYSDDSDAADGCCSSRFPSSPRARRSCSENLLPCTPRLLVAWQNQLLGGEFGHNQQQQQQQQQVEEEQQHEQDEQEERQEKHQHPDQHLHRNHHHHQDEQGDQSTCAASCEACSISLHSQQPIHVPSHFQNSDNVGLTRYPHGRHRSSIDSEGRDSTTLPSDMTPAWQRQPSLLREWAERGEFDWELVRAMEEIVRRSSCVTTADDESQTLPSGPAEEAAWGKDSSPFSGHGDRPILFPEILFEIAGDAGDEQGAWWDSGSCCSAAVQECQRLSRSCPMLDARC